MLALLLAIALSQQPAAVGSVVPTERPQRFTVTFMVAPDTDRWTFHRCPAIGQCQELARGPGSFGGATLDEAHGRVGDAYIVNVYRGSSVEKVTLGTIASTRYWAVLPVVTSGE